MLGEGGLDPGVLVLVRLVREHHDVVEMLAKDLANRVGKQELPDALPPGRALS
jgi:hypothetical protein